MDTVRIFDTTLRDGEQSPGATLTLAGKSRDRAPPRIDGRRYHRSGFSDRFAGRFRIGAGHRGKITGSTVCGLARCTPKDIERAGEAVKNAARSRIHIFLRDIEDPSRAQAEKGQGRYPQAGGGIDQAGAAVHGATSNFPPKTPAGRSWNFWKKSRRRRSRPARRRSICPTPSAMRRRRGTARSSRT